MKDAIFGWITGNEFCKDRGLLVYIHSLVASGFEGDKIIFTAEMPDGIRTLLDSFGFKVVDVPKNEVAVLYRDRHLAYYKYGLEHDYRFIITTDTRDVLFQHNPIYYLDTIAPPFFSDEFLYLVGEGFLHWQSAINIANQKRYEDSITHFKKDFLSWEVINGGIAVASSTRMRHFDSLVWMSGIHANGGDQCAINYLYHTVLKKQPSVVLLDPRKSVFCLTGEGYNINKEGFFSPKEYYLFHQWDRTPFAKDILAEWT